MQIENRREPRKSCELPVGVRIRNTDTGTETSSVSGVLFDVTGCGARLIVKKVLVDDRHLFLSPFNKENLSLVLSVAWEECHAFGAGDIAICAKPIWFDRLFIDGDESHPFWMGVKFQCKANDESVLKLLALVKAKKGKKCGWLEKLRHKFWHG